MVEGGVWVRTTETRKFPRLSLGAPDALDEAITLAETVHGVIRLAHGAHETAESVDVVLASNGAAVLINLGDGDLDGSVVLGLDQTCIQKSLVAGR